MQLPAKQQPLLQALPSQQGSPGEPQRAHRPVVEYDVLLQTVPATHWLAPFVPGQQVSPASPQDEQRLLRQERPAPQLVPQQGWPEAPHPEHFPAVHTPPLVPPAPLVPLMPPAPVPPQVADSATHCSL
jgi:hypothetical protein